MKILTLEQDLMATAIRDHIHGKTGKQVLVCHGVAGTGKTTVLTQIANEFAQAKLCAFTGKAASVLRAKSGLNALRYIACSAGWWTRVWMRRLASAF